MVKVKVYMSKKILLIDDEGLVVQSIGKLLQKEQ